MGAMKSLATEADYASVLRTANKFKEEADRLRALNAEMLATLKEIRKWMDAEEFGPWDAKFCADIDALIAKADR